MVFQTVINSMLASIWTGIICIQMYVGKICTYLDTQKLNMQCILCFLSPLALWEILENIKRDMEQHPQLALLNDPNQNI